MKRAQNLIEFLDAEAIANEICLLRDTFKGSVFVTEGCDDARLFQNFFAPEDVCAIVPAWGKSNALKVLGLLRKRGMDRGVLVGVDADFWHLTYEVPEDDAIVVTDFHDIEMDIAMSDAFDHVVREIGDHHKLASFKAALQSELRIFVLSKLHDISKARYNNYSAQLFVRFKDIPLEDFVDEDTLVVDSIGYLQLAVESSESAPDIRELIYEDMFFEEKQLPQLVRGHDFAVCLAIAFRSMLSDCPPSVACGKHVETLLRLAYSSDHFQRSELFRAIDAWEQRTGGRLLA